MRYIADVLTFTRFVLASVIIGLAIFDSQVDVGIGFMLFVIAELTDAFDGTFATRFPFPNGKAPKYRKYAAKYDMVADALTALAAALFFTLRVNFAVGVVMALSYGVVAAIIDMVVYGRLLGHPDDASSSSLIKRNFPLAKKIIMTRRMVYLLLIGVMATWMLYAAGWNLVVKIIIAIIAIFVVVFLWFFLAQRRKHISRDAVEIEEKLAKKK